MKATEFPESYARSYEVVQFSIAVRNFRCHFRS